MIIPGGVEHGLDESVFSAHVTDVVVAIAACQIFFECSVLRRALRIRAQVIAKGELVGDIRVAGGANVHMMAPHSVRVLAEVEAARRPGNLSIEAFAANHEYMSSQYEINVKHSGALDAADRAFMLKAAVKEIAVREGLLATFMGRPFTDQGGSGFHLHFSLNGEDGENGFAGDPRADGLSPLAASFVAGVIDHAQGLQALLGPTINSYKRILPDSLAPTHANWGHDNRTAFCRIPKERGSKARVEVRTGDGSANAHLITAAILLAGLDGIERGLEPPEPVVGDAYRMDEAHAGTGLPEDLGAALDALEADTWLVERLGQQLVSTFVAMKRFEVERFQEVVGELDRDVITVWEVEEYAAHL